MGRLKYSTLVFAVLISGLRLAFGGQAVVVSVKEFFDNAEHVVIVDVKKVTKVEVATGNNQISDVYVAKAEVLQTLKSGRSPTPEKRKIAIVGSTIPNSSAVWRPIETTRYLAFLNPKQGHYRFNKKCAMRPISPEGKVEWSEKKSDGFWEHVSIDIEEALNRIKENSR